MIYHEAASNLTFVFEFLTWNYMRLWPNRSVFWNVHNMTIYIQKCINFNYQVLSSTRQTSYSLQNVLFWTLLPWAIMVHRFRLIATAWWEDQGSILRLQPSTGNFFVWRIHQDTYFFGTKTSLEYTIDLFKSFPFLARSNFVVIFISRNFLKVMNSTFSIETSKMEILRPGILCF